MMAAPDGAIQEQLREPLSQTQQECVVMSIQSILDRTGAKVITIRATETVRRAADRMRERGIAALVVTSGDAITGLISERDIVHAISRHGEPALAMAVLDFVPQTTI